VDKYGEGAVTKAFFPSVRNRLRQKIPIFPEFTTMLTGHGKLRSYLYRFGLTDNPMCPCEEEQTTDYLIF
jgi:hypothetical protein